MKLPEECTTIAEVRAEIDALDAQIVQLLGQRFHYVKSIVRFKQNEAEVAAPDRFAAVLAQRREWAAEVGLAPDIVEALYRLLIGHFIEEETKLLHQSQKST